jgi:hypothetical protein
MLHIDKRAMVTMDGTATYVITIRDTGHGGVAGARVVDDLSGLLDDAGYRWDAAASLGRITYRRPYLTWRGDVPDGAVVTIRYSARVDQGRAGDGVLRNTVYTPSDGPRSNCAERSDDPHCHTVTRWPDHGSTSTGHWSGGGSGYVPGGGGGTAQLGPAAGKGPIPFTGAPVAWLLALAGGLLGGGVLLALRGRRRRTARR